MERGANDWWPRFSREEYGRRYDALRRAMAERGLDCLAVYGAPLFFGTDPGAPNLVYLSAYAPGLHGYVVFPREGDPTLAIYVAGHLANARELSVIGDVRGGTDLAGIIRERVRELGCERGTIGVVGNFAWSNVSVPLEHHEALKSYLPDARIEIVTGWYEEHRLAKSAEEIEFMAAGAAICDRAFDAFRRMAAPGVTDVALHNEALRVVHAQGGRIAFGHVGSTPMRDPGMTYPGFYPTNRVLQRGDAVMTELTGGYGGYFGKLYTTSFIGPPLPEYELMFELAAESYRRLVAALTPGMCGRDLAPALAGKAADSGYKPMSFITGWSTYNSRPVLFSRRSEAADREFELRPGYCLNVAGWVVSNDERKGVWVGDTVILTDQGARRLHRSPVDQLAANILGG
ncbi:MAG: aminopeptidase P family protein [Burkholderiales bacterium]|nr:aminopeptidase P family protein [Burkholderiales bacterium]